MKTGIFSSLVAVSALPLAAARPHAVNEQRDVVTKVTYVTATAPAAIVYVDQAGTPYATSYFQQTVVQATDAPDADASAARTHTLRIPKAEATAPAGKGKGKGKGHHHHHHASSAGSGLTKHANGITYSPYNADGSCKSQDQVNSDFAPLGDFSMVRIYGVDCDQATTVGNAAKAKGMKVFAGIYDIGQVNSEVQTLVDAVNGDWSHIDTVSIGNELVNSGAASVADVVSAVNVARPLLRAAGYNGPVVTADTFIAIINNPELCQASDYAAANCHAFFDSQIDAAGAGAYVKQQKELVKQACGGMKTVITESGWPRQGAANGAAVPSVANQKAAIASLQSAMPGNQLILYTAYDNLWLSNNANTFAAEQFWGIF